jgi:hypothetical protein
MPKPDATPRTVLTVSIKGPGGDGHITYAYTSHIDAGRIYAQIADILAKQSAPAQK